MNILLVDQTVVVDVGEIARVDDVMIDARSDVVEVCAVERAGVIGIDRELRAIDRIVVGTGRDEEGDS